MVKKERVLEKIKEKKNQKQQIVLKIENHERLLKNNKEILEELNLEILLLEDHVKKMDG